jgi:hypothetical protein
MTRRIASFPTRRVNFVTAVICELRYLRDEEVSPRRASP